MLTAGMDNITGTAGNDTINGVANTAMWFFGSGDNTLQASDAINGGAGKDSLVVTLEVGSQGVLPSAQYSNLENYFLRNVSGNTPNETFNFSTVTGEEQVWNDRSAPDSGVVVTGLAAGTTIGVKGVGAPVGSTTAIYAAGATAANIALDGGLAANPNGVVTGAVTIDNSPGSASLASASLSSTGGSNNIAGLNLPGSTTALTLSASTAFAITDGVTGSGNETIVASGLESITINGAGTANLGEGAIPASVKSVTASDSTGGVTFRMSAQPDIKFVGSSGNDVVTTNNNAAALLAKSSIDAGAGSADRLVVTNTNDIRVDGTSKAKGDLYKGFEQVQVQAGVSVNLANLSTNNTIDTVRINASTAVATTVTGLSATAAQNVTIMNAQGGPITIGIAGATNSGQMDTLKAGVTTTSATGTAANRDLTGLVLTGVESLELTGSNGAVATNVGRIQTNTATAIDLASIKLNNANAVDTNAGNNNTITIAPAHRAINLNVDATGSGDTTLNASAYSTITGASLTTGAGNDEIIGSVRADIISAGSGDDVINGGDILVAGPVTAATADAVTIDFTGRTISIGDTVEVTIGGQLYTATATAANAPNLANALANAIITGPANANINADEVDIDGGAITVVSANTGATSNLVADVNAVFTTNPAAGGVLTGATVTTLTSSDAVAAVRTLTFDTTAGSFAAGQVITLDFVDGAYIPATTQTPAVGTPTQITVTLTTEIVPGDSVATAANVAQSVLNAILAETTTLNDGNVASPATNGVIATRSGNKITFTSETAGGTAGSDNWSVLPASLVGTAITQATTTAGADALAGISSVDLNDATFNEGDIVTISFVDSFGDAISYSYTVADGDTVTQVEAGLLAAVPEDSDPTTNTDPWNQPLVPGVLAVTDSQSGSTNGELSPLAVTVDRAPIESNVAVTRVEGVDPVPSGVVISAGADRMTGGEGNDVFVINYSNVNIVGRLGVTAATVDTDAGNRVTFSWMDTITDLDLGGSDEASNVDTIDLSFVIQALVNAGTPVAMSSTATDLYDAVQALYGTGGTMDLVAVPTAGLFTYGSDTYLIAEAIGNSQFGTDDIIIKVTGLTGTLNLTDFE